MIEYKDSGNIDCVFIKNNDGSTWSGTKEAYLEQIESQKTNLPIPPDTSETEAE
jgi:hypothetical protein